MEDLVAPGNQTINTSGEYLAVLNSISGEFNIVPHYCDDEDYIVNIYRPTVYC